MHLHEAHPAVVIDGHVGELPTCAFDGVAAVAGDAVAGALDAPELLGVHVQHGSGRGVFVPNHRYSGLQCLQAGEAKLGQPTADGGHAAPDHGGDAAHGHSVAAQLLDALAQRLIDGAACPGGA